MVGLYFALREYKVLSVIHWKQATCIRAAKMWIPKATRIVYVNIISLLKKKKQTKVA